MRFLSFRLLQGSGGRNRQMRELSLKPSPYLYQSRRGQYLPRANPPTIYSKMCCNYCIAKQQALLKHGNMTSIGALLTEHCRILAFEMKLYIFARVVQFHLIFFKALEILNRQVFFTYIFCVSSTRRGGVLVPRGREVHLRYF